MGIFDFLGKDEQPAQQPVPRQEPEGALANAASGLVQRLLDVGIDGKGTFDSAGQVAQTASGRHADQEKAIADIVKEHTKLAAAAGFVTGLGGFITLPVALPANVVGFYLLATRMAASIAAVRGYDVDKPSVRSAILLSLVGADAGDVLQKAGYAGASGRLATFATQRLPGPLLMAVNKGVGFRVLTQLGRKSLTKLGRGIPLAGGALGAGLDSFMIRRIADHVRKEFPAQDKPLPGEVVRGELSSD
ncbi:hypothetical protein BJY21_004104 [Kineosphaera limosa]|uniref:EcsC family protein n=1 Tax=Kineosphaera limosa NBRC 100340 TaxID=1184609 RepID=K6WKQ0_9MICO|nr:EcsC family protein [Kineosphaera limosa]NYE02920.1 hypothetical protein [Kineosphaera limosa]GAB94351.1 hypothetical protein KILIM_004_01430 [Kineosphaera limosa NBRC 100340]